MDDLDIFLRIAKVQERVMEVKLEKELKEKGKDKGNVKQMLNVLSVESTATMQLSVGEKTKIKPINKVLTQRKGQILCTTSHNQIFSININKLKVEYHWHN